ncbi:MAG: sulfotransferase [Planctomycetota bacterium]
MNPIPKPLRKICPDCFQSSVQWANWGAVSHYLARKNPPLSPPVVVLSMPRSGSSWVGEISMPRSGSSWVGEILGSSPTAMYFYEPITKTYLRKIKSRPGVFEDAQKRLRYSQDEPSFFEFSQNELPYTYEASAKNAFSGIPFFHKRKVIFRPQQWLLSDRRRKRVIVKEISPFMLDWFIKEFRPRIIYLIRHPAAVACSFKRLGWTGKQFESRLSQMTLDKKVPHYSKFTHSFWAEQGAFYAFILKEVLLQTRGYKDFRIVQYEDLCTHPMNAFKELYEYAELEWDEEVEREIKKRTESDQINSDPFSVQRKTVHEVDKWKNEIPDDKVDQLKAAYFSFDPPYYRENW